MLQMFKIKCLWCDKPFDSIMASCGTGTTWSLYRCPYCKKLMADGDIIPDIVKTNPRIKIMGGSSITAIGEATLSGSKADILLTLIDNWKKLCKKSLSEKKIKSDPYSKGVITGELRAIETMRKFIEEASDG